MTNFIHPLPSIALVRVPRTTLIHNPQSCSWGAGKTIYHESLKKYLPAAAGRFSPHLKQALALNFAVVLKKGEP